MGLAFFIPLDLSYEVRLPYAEGLGTDGTAVRKLQIDKKRNVVLIEPDGTKKPMTFKEVSCEFGGNVIMRLTQGIQICGADISTVELD